MRNKNCITRGIVLAAVILSPRVAVAEDLGQEPGGVVPRAGGCASDCATGVCFFWEGDRNNNWDNSRNWCQDPGGGDIPDASNHDVEFPDSNVDRWNVDLQNATRDVRDMLFRDSRSKNYRVQTGKLRIHRSLFATGVISGSILKFRSDLTIEQVNSGFWTMPLNAYSVFLNGPLIGSGDITVEGRITLNAANTYSGTMTIAAGRVRVGHSLALQDATVIANSAGTNVVDVTTDNVNATLGALGGGGI